MSAAYGYGLCGILSPDLSPEEMHERVIEFAHHGFAPLFHEVIDGTCLRVSWSETDGVNIEERNDAETESIIAIWGKIGSFSYDEWEMLGCDILVPGSSLGATIKAVAIPGASDEQRVRDADAALADVLENADHFSFADYLIDMMKTAIEKQVLLTVAA